MSHNWWLIKIFRPNEEVERVRRSHQNDLENVPIFLLLGLFYLLGWVQNWYTIYDTYHMVHIVWTIKKLAFEPDIFNTIWAIFYSPKIVFEQNKQKEMATILAFAHDSIFMDSLRPELVTHYRTCGSNRKAWEDWVSSLDLWFHFPLLSNFAFEHESCYMTNKEFITVKPTMKISQTARKKSIIVKCKLLSEIS